MTVRATALLFSILLFATSAGAESSPVRTHVVYDGQRLGSIAKRYGVSVDALCTANGLRTSDRIRVGQRLLIPARDDRDGSRARAALSKGSSRRRSGSEPARPGELPEALTHRVESGQRLESIARRYRVTVRGLCEANSLDEKVTLRIGQVLRIPFSGTQPAHESPGVGASSYRAYLKAPRRKGYVDLYGYNQRWRGHVFDKRGRLLPAAASGISRVLGTGGKRPSLDPRLLRLIVQVSDTFGGRAVRVVSGYRNTSFFKDSRHKQSSAVDFSIPGVPNEVLRDYLRTLPNTGIGYYPNSSFVHLDVRPYSAYWVDYAGPGQAPRRSRFARVAASGREPQAAHEEEHPGEVALHEHATPTQPEAAGAPPAPESPTVDAAPSSAWDSPQALQKGSSPLATEQRARLPHQGTFEP